MIAYTEKGADLHDCIVAAGHRLEYQVDAEGARWIADDDQAVQAIIDAYTLADARAWKKRLIEAHAEALLTAFVEALHYSPAEMASWSQLRAEAVAFAASADPADAPMLAAEAAAAEVPLAALVQRVAANANAYGAYLAGVKGARTKHKAAVDALTDFAEIARYPVNTGWPG